jgi:Flp pilus assembly pilin Flp
MMTTGRITLTEELGQTMAEYAFVLTVIVIAIITAFESCQVHCVVDRQRGHHRQECVLSAKTTSPGQFRGRRLTHRKSGNTMIKKRIDIRSDRGQTMVEFALVVPILLMVVFAIIQFGMLYNNYIT